MTSRDARRTLETRFPASLHIPARGKPQPTSSPPPSTMPKKQRAGRRANARGGAKGGKARKTASSLDLDANDPADNAFKLVSPRFLVDRNCSSLISRSHTSSSLNVEKVIQHNYTIARALQITGNLVTRLARGATRG